MESGDHQKAMLGELSPPSAAAPRLTVNYTSCGCWYLNYRCHVASRPRPPASFFACLPCRDARSQKPEACNALFAPTQRRLPPPPSSLQSPPRSFNSLHTIGIAAFAVLCLNGFFAVLCINSAFSLLSANSAFSLLSVNSAFSLLSANSAFALGCKHENFSICLYR